MVYAWTQELPIDSDFYRRITSALGDEPMDGLLLHLAVRKPDGTLQYIDVWESKEHCDRAFAERIHPAVYAVFTEATGAPPRVEPERHLLDVVEVRGPASVVRA